MLGKTTIINLLLRFYDINRGKISIDSVSIKSITKASLRKNIGTVLQEPWIKKGSIIDNIKMGRKDANMEDVIHASKESLAYDFIMRLPEGFETIVDNDSNLLSEGEKQLICIARVILANPKILVLDEATSNIDSRTELLVQSAFDNVMKNKTTIVIAHRLSTILNADKIVVLDNQKIVEEGNHKELLAKKGLYYELFNAQYKK